MFTELVPTFAGSLQNRHYILEVNKYTSFQVSSKCSHCRGLNQSVFSEILFFLEE
jgi:hypothetical protein